MYEFISAYRGILLNESNNKKILNIISKWKKKYLKDAKDKKKVNQSLDNITKLTMSGEDNMDIMDKITENIINIGKEYDSTKDEKALDDLGDILGVL